MAGGFLPEEPDRVAAVVQVEVEGDAPHNDEAGGEGEKQPGDAATTAPQYGGLPQIVQFMSYKPKPHLLIPKKVGASCERDSRGSLVRLWVVGLGGGWVGWLGGLDGLDWWDGHQ